jgi:outer membrane protein assembly factor BamE (lipoprotein component of BamABCDE complex)
MKQAKALAIMVLLSACSSSGIKVDQSALSEFTAGKSTCSDVAARLGQPNITKPSGEDPRKTVWVYTFSSAQAHPENFIPVVGAFVGGYDREATAAAFRFTSDCVLDGTRYASMNMGSGVNMEGVAQARKDTRVAE